MQNTTQALGWVKDPTGVIWYFDPHGILNPGSICIHGILIALIENWSPCVVNLTPWYIKPPTHGSLTILSMAFCHPLQMAYQTLYPWYFGPLSIVLWPPTHGILSPLSMVYRTPIHGILEPLTMVLWPSYPWYIGPHIHGILNPLPIVSSPPFIWYTEPSTHDISNPLSMVFWPPCQWYLEPNIHGTYNLLSMVYWTPNLW